MILFKQINIEEERNMTTIKQLKRYGKNYMDSLYSVCWNITSNCNENCKFCFRKKCNENTLEENKKIFQ